MQRVRQSIEIGADVEQVFAQWTRFEELPRLMDGVRRTKQIGERRILWDADIAGRRVFWEAEVVESIPGRRIRWESRWGAENAGEVGFEVLPGGRTRLTVDIRYRPRGILERLGSRLGLLRARIRQDLASFRRQMEAASRESEPALDVSRGSEPVLDVWGRSVSRGRDGPRQVGMR